MRKLSEINRRQFLFGAGAAVCASGCRTVWPLGAPELRFGVVSDIHLTTPESCARLERAFRQMRARDVDAVMIPGDLSDYGTRTGWLHLKRTWDRVFAGTEVVPLFCTGNHDFEGWRYVDMAVDMYANGYDGTDAVSNLGVEKVWQEVFGEPYAPIRLRTVKGYDFVSAEYGAEKDLAAWMAENGARFRGTKPFFFFQHLPVNGTTADAGGWSDKGVVKPVLDPFVNCVSFTGHTHRTFNDERSVWQGEYTAFATPSLSYASMPHGYENGSAKRNGQATNAMRAVPTRLDHRGGQGFIVSVYSDRMVVERRDFEEETEGAEPWEIPLPHEGPGPYAYAVREKTAPAPEFPTDARVQVRTANTEDRQGKWIIVTDCRFPSAKMPDGSRVCDYEIRAVPQDGSAPLVKRFLSPAFAELPGREPEEQRFWFNVAGLPIERDYVLEVRARNFFGRASSPLISGVRRSVSKKQ